MGVSWCRLVVLGLWNDVCNLAKLSEDRVQSFFRQLFWSLPRFRSYELDLEKVCGIPVKIFEPWSASDPASLDAPEGIKPGFQRFHVQLLYQCV